MPQRLFQDVAGTIPAVLPGDPVGLSIRAAGDVNATQGVALAKPTLVRWPATGRRNLANGAQAVDNPTYWPVSKTTNGVTVTRIGYGVDPTDGVPYADVRFSGTPIIPETRIEPMYVNSRAVASLGSMFAGMAYVQIIADVTPTTGVNRGFSFRIEGSNIAGTYSEGGNAPTQAVSTSMTKITFAYTMSNAGTVRAQIVPWVRSTAGQPIDVTYRIKGIQFERGLVESPLQLNYGPNNITEPGVPDKWHLYNDGGDSLSTVLPAGTYGTAHLIADGSYTFGTVVSDGVTPITTIPNDRQVDAIYRLGAFNAEEQANILAYWQRKFPQ